MIKVYWLAACIAPKVVGAVLIVFLRLWRKIKFAYLLQSTRSKGQYLKKCPNPAVPIRSKETWTKYTPLTLLSQRKLALTARNTIFAVIKALEVLQPKKFKN